MKQTLISNHFTLKTPEKSLQTSLKPADPEPKTKPVRNKRKPLEAKTKPLEKKIKITEKDSEIVVTFENAPAKTRKSPVKKVACLNPDWKTLLKSNENSMNFGCMFQNHPSSFNEKSTTQATLDSFKANSMGTSITFEKNPLGNNVEIVPLEKEKLVFRKISFEEEETNQMIKEKKMMTTGFSKETEEILQTMREKKMDFQKKNEYNSKSQSISKETQEILQQIKSKSSIREQLKNKIENNLIGSQELPSEYRRIITKFDTFENVLFFQVFRKIPTFFQNLSQETKISLKEFQQILFIFPNEYDLKWEKNATCKNEYDLHISFPSNALNEKTNFVKSVENRRELFKQRVVSFWKQQQNLMETKEKSCFSEHYDNLNILCIPEKELPTKPNQKNVESLKDFLQRSEQLKNKELMTIMKETALKTEQQNETFIENEDQKKFESSLKKNGISENLLAKIKEKEKMMNLMKNRSQPEKRVLKLEEMICIVDIIKYHFSVRDVNNMFLINLAKFIHDSNTTFIMSEVDIISLIEKLAEMCPNWLKILNHEAGKLVRINKEVPVFNVLKHLRSL